MTAFARALEAAAAGKMLSIETGPRRDRRAVVPARALTPVEAAATMAGSARGVRAARERSEAPRRLVLLGGFAIVAGGGVWLVRGPLRRAARAGRTDRRRRPARGRPPLARPPSPTARGAKPPTPSTDEPAAVDDDTDSAAPTVTTWRR